MYDGETGWYAESNEWYPGDRGSPQTKGNDASVTARRRIERLRELRHLRDLLEDPAFDDLDWTAGRSVILETANEKTAKNED
ncbi:MAG: hypothetical protein LJE70_02275 [Chromatiaceae bacterium]|jgi:hypothetical protein|nr:hypothetical protein [Chromatiaceae bacterium]